ncbi:DUF4124 domain-containing protein [Entomomonas asaccharolytica]|uniref:DUF4124 domain-containing protein n=1 Tax=Entomomonas asaccharolytica TaxID=2785331 RepID=A0A974RWL8_9GAMM|nr:DUF4124 domain-containing protein [Entomomonas asaccharolytica]QQP85282.1 DUF4124 domain-containing protein [Entomomonas asaccharolytica]
MKKLSFITLLLACASLNAQVYSYVDSNGNTIYTDNPPENQATRNLDIKVTPSVNKTENNVDEADLKTVRLSPTTPINVPNASNGESNAPFKVISINYQSLTIVTPEHEDTITNSDGQLMITLESSPKLSSNHKYRIIIDGETVGESTSPTFSINNLERGEHKLVAKIIDSDKNVIKKTEQQVFYIRQTTLADKRRVRPCKYRDFGVRPECPLKDKPKPDPRILRKITDKLGITKPCDLTDYGVRKDCPIELKPLTPTEEAKTKNNSKKAM